MSLLPATLGFGETTLAIIDRQWRTLLSARELARLWATRMKVPLRIYSRNDEFTNDDINGQIDR